MFPNGEMVVEDPFFIDPNVGCSLSGSNPQQKNPGEDEPDSLQKLKSLMVIKILQNSAFKRLSRLLPRGGS